MRSRRSKVTMESQTPRVIRVRDDDEYFGSVARLNYVCEIELKGFLSFGLCLGKRKADYRVFIGRVLPCVFVQHVVETNGFRRCFVWLTREQIIFFFKNRLFVFLIVFPDAFSNAFQYHHALAKETSGVPMCFSVCLRICLDYPLTRLLNTCISAILACSVPPAIIHCV